ncbi:CDP-glycerol glycerophosphotransferase family protein [Leuconostoc mesenteroides]|uniref:CDP-glycerol glycerophosphotransferase family protein n=1 Tax=Leuconostoc mesenteroides TaxID=1245 RepID=UPI000A03BD39|nr:CDP-glycerol glycerophosphotransferase family protein [Leuconostoc mesenteroides]ORI35610.1 hypothetical protein BMR90_08550 [Leuconostoc mesenteroides subsp. cremoris]ORI35752.1 hypothetical protein BMR89_07845 [Leuconostoc mesenteroides subsp. cremoris]ORI40298.1 hypothetical protein BMR91_08090 [Leuconostoc mesenteroides subsp. cremoris]ORI40681.1 hypothetical protein BMR92_07720 [Leuconostoc mesenteroides subsp. cremoris]ORI41115.1 hypothetical protein BMR93_07815 [Leuconostoc mesentero
MNGNLKAIFDSISIKNSNWHFFWFVDSLSSIQNFPLNINLIVRGGTQADCVLSKADIIFEDKFHKTYPSSISYNTPIINLWHGVGLKEVELNNPINGFLADRVMSRYIMSSTIYKNQSYFVTTSAYMTQWIEVNI